MRFRHRAMALIVAAMGVSRAAMADAPLLTERAAVQAALQNQPALRAAAAESQMARARVGAARSEGKLQISINALADWSDAVNSFTVPTVMPQSILMSQSRNSADLNGMLMLPVATGGRIREMVRAAEFSAGVAENQVAAARVEAAYTARARFADWRAAVAMARVAYDSLAAQQETTDVAQQLFEVGKIPQFDLLWNQAALAAAKQQVANADADVAAARARLAQAMGVPESTLGSSADEPPASPPADALTTALTKRPDLAAAAQSIAAAQAVARARNAAYRPQVYAFGMADASSPSDVGKIPTKTVGIIAGIPLADGGRRRSDLDEALQAVVRAQAQRDSIELQVRADVSEAEARLQAARLNIQTAGAQIASAQAAYAVAQERYAAGKSTVVELLDALRTRTEARQSLLVAQAQYATRLAELYRAMGIDVAQ